MKGKLRIFILFIGIGLSAISFQSIGQTAKSFFTAGVVELTSNNYEKAIENFNQAIKLDKKYTDAYFNRAIAYEKLGKDKKALKDYGVVIKQQPDNASAFINRGLLYFKLENLTEAIADYTQAIKLNPDNSFAYLHRGKAYKKNSQFEKAKEDYLKVLERLPNLKAVHTDLIEIYLSESDYTNCVKHYSILIDSDSTNAELFEGRGNCYEKLGENQNACNDYTKAKELGIATLDDAIERVCGN